MCDEKKAMQGLIDTLKNNEKANKKFLFKIVEGKRSHYIYIYMSTTRLSELFEDIESPPVRLVFGPGFGDKSPTFLRVTSMSVRLLWSLETVALV